MQRQQLCSVLNIDLSSDMDVDMFKGVEKDYVRLRGVPFTATPEDVIAFIGDLKSNIAHQGVHMVLNAVVGVVWVV